MKHQLEDDASILHEDLRKKKICARFVPHRLTSCQGFIQTCQDNFIYGVFLFPRVKNVFKGKRFQDVEDIKKNVTVELNAVTLEAFTDCFQKMFNDSANVFKLAEINLNRNIFLYPCIFISFFTPVLEIYCQTL
jgi:hypothetical protein